MTTEKNAEVGCVHVGNYVDEGGNQASLESLRGEVVRPEVVSSYLDVWGRDDGLREFTILLKNGQVIVVRGHTLKCELPQASLFSIIVRSDGEEVTVALFKSDEVSGIFDGEIQPDRRIA